MMNNSSEPSVRGVLVAVDSIAITSGPFIVNLLWNLLGWRNVTLLCLFVPIVTIIALFFVSIFHQKPFKCLNAFEMF